MAGLVPAIHVFVWNILDVDARHKAGHDRGKRTGQLEAENAMKRLHVHVAVDDLQRSVRFYAALFAAQPSVTKPDYAKWMLEDPRVNFAISTRGREPGLDHLGIQAEDEGELKEIYARLHRAGGEVIEQGQTSCCYAKSEKSWIDDPSGISWETFFTAGESTDYGDGSGERVARVAHEKSCCTPPPAPAACGRSVA
jgi:catechol 2,3-dioxygenase-like lactoylglutathione lyase family enzyme